MTTALEARNLTVSATLGGRRIDLLRAIDFSLPAGGVLGLVGESGAGKSMIGRVIGRTLPANFSVSAGSLQFKGRDLLSLDARARLSLLGKDIAFIPQEPLTALNPTLTIGQQFSEHLARLGVARGERAARIIAALTEVRLRDPAALIDLYPFQLSGGMCQRVLIAMAFAGKPALIIADEPTTALDVSTQAHIVQIIRRMQRDTNTALLFITHDLRLASHVCDEILVLYAGDVVERGPARSITGDPRHPYTRALIAANPPLTTNAPRRLAALPDQMPGLAAFADLPGCRFAPRCAKRDPACVNAVPALLEVAPQHFARCAAGCLAAGHEAQTQLVTPRVARDTAPVLSVRDLAKYYPGKRRFLRGETPGVHAVRPISFDVRPGEFVGVVGESGSGKSTLAKLVMGLENASAGQILIDGQDVAQGAPNARFLRLDALQMVFQDPQSALNPRRPVQNLVTQSMESPRRPSTAAERLARAKALLTETGLAPEMLDRYPAQLSGGQKQRVNIARALCVTPRLLVADEIVSGLDVSVQAQILNLLIDLGASRDIGLLFISHDLAVVRYLCSRVLVMQNGYVVEDGACEQVFAAPQHPYTRALIAAAPPDDIDKPWPQDNRDHVAA